MEMKLNKKICMAQIGIGYWGPILLRNMVANENCEVKTVVDLSKERQYYVRGLYPSIKVSNKFFKWGFGGG